MKVTREYCKHCNKTTKHVEYSKPVVFHALWFFFGYGLFFVPLFPLINELAFIVAFPAWVLTWSFFSSEEATCDVCGTSDKEEDLYDQMEED